MPKKKSLCAYANDSFSFSACCTYWHVVIELFYLVSSQTVDLEITIVNQGFDQIGEICSLNISLQLIDSQGCCVCPQLVSRWRCARWCATSSSWAPGKCSWLCCSPWRLTSRGKGHVFLCEVPLQSVLGAFVASILPVVFVSDCCCSRKAARTWTCSLGSSQRPALLLPTLSVRPSRFLQATQSQ